MTRYEVLLSETAIRQLGAIPPELREHIKRSLGELKDDPYRSRPRADIKRLKGTKRDYYRIRIGSYRAIYVIEGYEVRVAKILPRSKAYGWID